MSTFAMQEYTTDKSMLLGNSTNAELLLQRKYALSVPKSLLTSQSEGKPRLQAKLSIGASNDPLEQEADRVADQVLAAPAHSAVSSSALHIQRFTGQGTADAGTVPASVDRVLSGSGSPLDPATQQDMGQRFGHDFSQVRVHTDFAAKQSAQDINAHAYTVGHNIVFGAGGFVPQSHEGRKLIAHELTHVVQQTGAAGIHAGQSDEKFTLSSGSNHTIQKQEAKPDANPEKDKIDDSTKNKTDNSMLSVQLAEPDFLTLKQPFFERNVFQLWDPSSALGVWKYNLDFFKRFGVSDKWAGKAANLTAPLAIDAQLKVSNPKWWEITDRELKTTSIVAPIPIFQFDANFKDWKPLPFLQK
ncbi:eCIS core domain-containing protein [Candidatus Nitrotoga sp. AM1P]|uniref:eCIS core domain-containing protein n=1 Tax=Candidatus Nitrotoga sp. AM1P TaxID=2559597 RepID=UPI0010B56591|nr:DUF4157 domain-containing protein [Candidatus Nitrotoga sp. AM1P]BBJ23432.1 hypothetical protein W01_13590 [Candidatus Nitrotoga sp. AM1P]